MITLSNYLRRRRLVRYQTLVARIRHLRAALNGIDYEIHPLEWEEVAGDLNRKTVKAERTFNNLGLSPNLKLH